MVRADVPTVADTKAAFIKSYRKPIPSIYSNVIQELLVQQHLMRYNSTYTYDPVFALGFVTVYDQLMDGYPNDADRDSIFKAYISALNEDPELYRSISPTTAHQFHTELLWIANLIGNMHECFLKNLFSNFDSHNIVHGPLHSPFKGIYQRYRSTVLNEVHA